MSFPLPHFPTWEKTLRVHGVTLASDRFVCWRNYVSFFIWGSGEVGKNKEIAF